MVNTLAIPVVRADTGGNNNPTIHLNIATGEVELKKPTGISKFSLA